MNRNHDTKLIHFLEQEMAVSPAELAVLLRHPEREYAPLPMLLWQYGLVTLSQLCQIFDWLEAQQYYPLPLSLSHPPAL